MKTYLRHNSAFQFEAHGLVQRKTKTNEKYGLKPIRQVLVHAYTGLIKSQVNLKKVRNQTDRQTDKHKEKKDNLWP